MTQGDGTTSSPDEADLPSPQERRRLRESAELTHGEVAAAVGVSPATVRSWESGRTQPRGRKRKAYARFITRLAASGPTDEPEGGAEASEGGKAAAPAAVRVSPAPARPISSRKRPKAAAKRAAKPPADSSRHESRTGVGTSVGTGGDHTPPPPEHGADPQPRPEPQPEPRSDPAPIAGAGTSTSTDTGAPTVEADTPTGEADAPPADPPAPDPPAARPPAAEAAAEAPAETPAEVEDPVDPGPLTPARAFDALHSYAAPALVRQAYLLTGRRSLALEAVDKAFLQAWARWPEVATDPDPVGWVRAVAYEYALSPWHRFRRAFRHPDKPPAEPADRITMDALLALPTAYRRAVLLYDGVGLDLPDTAAEIEASTPTAGLRLLNAHAQLTARLPELDGLPPAQRSARLRERMGSVRPAVCLDPRPAAAVRTSCERRSRALSRAALGLTAVIAVATAYTATTSPNQYIAPIAPGTSVSGVPPLSGPQRFTEQSKELHDRLHSDPAAGPARLAPKIE